MKEIKLKPQLEHGEKIIFKGKEYSAKISEYAHDVFFEDEKGKILMDGNGVYVCLFGGYEIIESPDHIADGGKPIECDCLMQIICTNCNRDCKYKCEAPLFAKCIKCGVEAHHTTKNHIADDGKKVDAKFGFTFPKPICAKGHSINCLVLHKDGSSCSLCDSKEKEKPPLKLRVGGVYKNASGNIRKIAAYNSAASAYQYTDTIDLSYRENGKYGELAQEHPYDLIEEVQLEDDSDEKFSFCVMKYPGELKSLRKENAGLKEIIRKFEPALHLKHLANKSPVFAKFLEENFYKITYPDKPEGNPFKVGDKVNVYESNNDNGCMSAYDYCEVTEIWGPAVKLAMRPGESRWFYYKQCELVNE